ncbi:uncharacterized protein PSFLO_01232 [Pseudozyma flocculosa]|uniref:Uncharacterized protein n=1 Tax=Pseudozyma flocculosa TaxID=84751 RepID=A0A5C3EXE0_9BASI|nr:uncharacterized protein PSFLO_01232 [Pseudozyma flocculosa]
MGSGKGRARQAGSQPGGQSQVARNHRRSKTAPRGPPCGSSVVACVFYLPATTLDAFVRHGRYDACLAIPGPSSDPLKGDRALSHGSQKASCPGRPGLVVRGTRHS